MPNSGLGFEATLHSDGTFSTSIPIPSKLPNGDYQILFLDPSKNSNNPVIAKEIYIAPSANSSLHPKILHLLNIWADPPLLGTEVKIDGWVPKESPAIDVEINGGGGGMQQTLRVQSNGYFEGEVLLPETLTLTGGKAQFVISGFNNKVLLKKSVVVGNPYNPN